MRRLPFCLAAEPADLGADGAFQAVLPLGLCSQEALHDALAEALRLPDWYGRNWDALWDALISLDGIDENRVILFHREIPGLVGAGLRSYLELLADAVLDWRGSGEHELVVVFPPGSADALQAALVNGPA